jgi:hypothetical protein
MYESLNKADRMYKICVVGLSPCWEIYRCLAYMQCGRPPASRPSDSVYRLSNCEPGEEA